MSNLPFVSIRMHIKRGNEPAYEDTDTLVLTSSKKYYVDIRILLDPPTPSSTDPLSSVQWAFCGTAISTPPATPSSPTHTEWIHWLDSRTRDVVQDAGDMWPLASGDVLEKGEDGQGVYEELWRDLDVLPMQGGADKVKEVRRSWVLRCDGMMYGAESGGRGMICGIAGWAQGFWRNGDEMGVVRWTLKEDGKNWTRVVEIGQSPFPINGDLWKDGLEEGQEIMFEDGSIWVCLESFSW